MTIRVLIVDDHAVFAETLATALGSQDDIQVVGVASGVSEAGDLAAEHEPDVALLDIELPDGSGIDVAKALRRRTPGTRCLMLTGSLDASFFPKAMEAGASGYLLKEGRLRDVIDAVRRAAAGEVVVPPSVTGRLFAAPARPADGVGSDLTPREFEVLALLGEGSDVKSIAKSLGISWHTARSYVKNVLVKLGAHSQLEAVAIAVREGLLRPGS